jgi:hypothetical protein
MRLYTLVMQGMLVSRQSSQPAEIHRQATVLTCHEQKLGQRATTHRTWCLMPARVDAPGGGCTLQCCHRHHCCCCTTTTATCSATALVSAKSFQIKTHQVHLHYPNASTTHEYNLNTAAGQLGSKQERAAENFIVLCRTWCCRCLGSAAVDGQEGTPKQQAL